MDQKREDEMGDKRLKKRLYSTNHPDGITLDVETPVGKIFIALRDYAHHFAISHHRTRQRTNYKGE